MNEAASLPRRRGFMCQWHTDRVKLTKVQQKMTFCTAHAMIHMLHTMTARLLNGYTVMVAVEHSEVGHPPNGLL